MSLAETETYKRLKVLGEGSYGKALLCESLIDGSLCVIKELDLNFMSESEKRDTIKEAKILEALNHPNIIRFQEVYKTKAGKLCIVMDYADGISVWLIQAYFFSQAVIFRRRLLKPELTHCKKIRF